ncbi:SAV_915 family protein [Kribbella sp. NPDC051587]|uniref:SAV_915 family protein n=1 Tax=Kribbella sp. NPDC051587 TaxID=3364119 RepID=UPI0037997AB5
MKPRHCDDWYVPVHPAGGVGCTLQTGHLPDGRRVGIAFTTLTHLHTACGPHPEYLRMTEAALRESLQPLGITRIQLDPLRVTPAPHLAATG